MKMKIKVTTCASMELESIIIYHYTNKALRGHVSSVRWPISRLKTSHRATVPTKKVFFSLLFFYVFLFYEFIVVILYFRVTLPFRIPVAWFRVSFLYPSVSPVLSPRCVPEPSPTWFSRHFRFLSPNSMKTGSFSCFVCQSLIFFVFLSLLRRASPAIFDFYLHTP